MSLLLQQQQLQQQQLAKQQAPLPAPPTDEKEKEKQPYIWRMHSQTERKYQLFPKDKTQQPAAGKSLDPEQAFALAMGNKGNNDGTNTTAAGTTTTTTTTTSTEKANPGLRVRIKEHTLIRRRKVSVPELGPMTTVQEVAMDSRKLTPGLHFPILCILCL